MTSTHTNGIGPKISNNKHSHWWNKPLNIKWQALTQEKDHSVMLKRFRTQYQQNGIGPKMTSTNKRQWPLCLAKKVLFPISAGVAAPVARYLPGNTFIRLVSLWSQIWTWRCSGLSVQKDFEDDNTRGISTLCLFISEYRLTKYQSIWKIFWHCFPFALKDSRKKWRTYIIRKHRRART